ncbi:MAG: hypothetical protein AB1641_16120 [Thermodesulfobacteriota bacterium]
MTVLQFKRHNVVSEIIQSLQDDKDEVLEAIVIGKKKSGGRFSFMTVTENLPELIGYLEAVKADLVMEMITQADRADD